MKVSAPVSLSPHVFVLFQHPQSVAVITRMLLRTWRAVLYYTRSSSFSNRLSPWQCEKHRRNDWVKNISAVLQLVSRLASGLATLLTFFYLFIYLFLYILFYKGKNRTMMKYSIHRRSSVHSEHRKLQYKKHYKYNKNKWSTTLYKGKHQIKLKDMWLSIKWSRMCIHVNVVCMNDHFCESQFIDDQCCNWLNKKKGPLRTLFAFTTTKFNHFSSGVS